MQTPIQETDPLPEIELIGAGTRRVADRTARQETLLPGRDGFTGRDPDQSPWEFVHGELLHGQLVYGRTRIPWDFKGALGVWG